MIYFIANGQAIDNTLSFKDINNDRYLRLNYENDFFAATDIYYTWGMNIEFVAPWMKRSLFSKVLFHPKYSYIKYGIGIEQDAYTPINEDTNKIVIGDRPFAASLLFKMFQTSIDPEKKQRFSTTLSTGILGPGAGGMDIQTAAHIILPHNSAPEGWQNQVRNDVILNYQVDYEKQLISLGHTFSVDADAILRSGTLSDKASIGTTLLMGSFDSPYQIILARKNHFSFYAYEHAQIDLVGYDATLQGGIFNHNSPYTIATGNITRGVFENRFGLVLNYKKICLEYFQSYLSPEFKTGNYHVWGGFQIAIGM